MHKIVFFEMKVFRVLMFGMFPLSFICSQTLRDEAANHGIKVGSISRNDYWAFSDTETYQKTLSQEFSILAVENHLKMKWLQPEEGVFDFSKGDQHVQFAKEHDMEVHGHVLVWHNGSPNWIKENDYGREKMLELMKSHITTVIRHYGMDVPVWDVVNEVWLDTGLRDSYWRKKIGDDYIEKAFQYAREAHPDIKLFYNDYGAEQLNAKSDFIYNMCVDFIDRGIPIDGVGFQCHLGLNSNLSSFALNLQRFADLGLEVHITELDVRIPYKGEDSADFVSCESLIQQAEIIEQVAEIAMAQPSCKNLTLWGFTDKYSWLDNYTEGQAGNGLIFDREYQKKPSYRALMEGLKKGRAGGESNEQPVSSFIAPDPSAQYEEGQDLTFSVDARDPDGELVKVEFYDGSNKIGEDRRTPFSLVYENIAPGGHLISAKAIDDDGLSHSSFLKLDVTSRACDDGNVSVRIKVTKGDADNVELRIDDQIVHTWTVRGGVYSDYCFDYQKTGAHNVKVYFQDNSANIRVDYLKVGSSIYQSEDQPVNTAVWNGSDCGGSYSEKMTCDGYIDFGMINFSKN